MGVPLAEKLRQLAGDLSELAAMPVRDEDQLEAWYAAARRIEEGIRTDPVLSDAVPHFIWHYLADADIRRGEPVYYAEQTQQLMGLLEWLHRGEVPS
ncbi:MAG: hypothetical protein ABFS41_04090 [Myxococcota bacterium]